MHKYEVILYWSNDDQAFIAEVPELPGCAAHGRTPDEALANCLKSPFLFYCSTIPLLDYFNLRKPDRITIPSLCPFSVSFLPPS